MRGGKNLSRHKHAKLNRPQLRHSLHTAKKRRRLYLPPGWGHATPAFRVVPRADVYFYQKYQLPQSRYFFGNFRSSQPREGSWEQQDLPDRTEKLILQEGKLLFQSCPFWVLVSEEKGSYLKDAKTPSQMASCPPDPTDRTAGRVEAEALRRKVVKGQVSLP